MTLVVTKRSRKSGFRRARPELTPGPITRRMTALRLLRRAVHLMEEDPRRVDLTTWIWRRPEGMLLTHTEPDCGTTGCIAGWLVMLAGSDPEEKQNTAATQARALLGFKRPRQGRRDPVADLFFNSAPLDAPQPGTPAYARGVIKNIRAFMRTHNERLRAHYVDPPRRASP
jgi:hypothetical protein